MLCSRSLARVRGSDAATVAVVEGEKARNAPDLGAGRRGSSSLKVPAAGAFFSQAVGRCIDARARIMPHILCLVTTARQAMEKTGVAKAETAHTEDKPAATSCCVIS